MKGKKLMEINARDLYNINVLMLKRSGAAEVVTKETIIDKGDILVVFGPRQAIKKLFTTKAEKEKKE